MERRTASNGQARRADALLAELMQADMAGRRCGRGARHSYFHRQPDLSAARIRRQTGIALVLMLGVLALLAGWAVVALVRGLADSLGPGLAPRVSAGDVRALLMTLPLA